MKTSRRLVWSRNVLASRSPRRSPRAVWRLLRLSPLGAGVAVLAGLPAISAWAQSTGAAANIIKPDGRTATRQAVVGTRTDISTGTVRGDNAFNSFSRFEVGQGQTVNVHVPTTAQRVINIVTDAPIKVDGVLNGLKDGSLSGNLVFADPMGMVVSKTGVINVNSLQVVAPSKTHLDAMMDGQGRIGDAAVRQLLDGQAPRSAEGRIQIDGKINALEKVRLEARRIDIDGRIKAGADAAHDAAFRAAVSTQGLSVAIGMVERGGVIELIADDGVNLNGQLDASQRVALSAPDAPKAGLGGGVDIRAEKIELGADSHIDVSGLTGGGVAVIGSVSLPAVALSSSEGSTPVSTPAPNAPPVTQTLMAAKGSKVEADAIERGNGGRIQYLSDGSADWGGFGSSRGGALMGHGGFVEVSGRRRAQVYGLVDTTAPKGMTGKLLIDPKHLLIANGEAGDSTCRNDAAAETCTLNTGSVVALASKANLELLASDSISFAAGTKLDLYTVLTDSASQSIAFTSKDITLNSEAKIVTGGGSVKLNAGGQIWMAKDSAIITRGVGNADSSTAELTSHAGDVSLQGKSIRLDQGSSILAHRVSSFSNYLGGKVELKASSAQQYHLGLASASSGITLAGTIKAERISVTADARAEATPSGPTGYAVQYVLANIGALTGMGAAYHETQADAKIEVQGTATLNARTTLDLLSNSVNRAAGSVDVATVQDNGTTLPTLGALVVRSAGRADVQVKSGAKLQSGGKTTVAAYNDATAHGAVSLTSTNSESGLAVSYVDARVSSNAQIDAGAVVQVGALDLLSLQTGNMRSTVDVKLMRRQPVDGQTPPVDAAIGSSVAVSLLNVSSSATLGANVLGYDGVGKTGNVTVVSDTSLSQNFSSARTQVVPFGVVDIVAAEKTKLFQPYANLLPDLLSNWLDDKAKLLKSGTNEFPLKASAVVTFNETDLSSAARIGKAAVVSAAGNVAVVAQTEDRAIHNIADSTVNTRNAKTSRPAGSAAVAVGQYEHNAEATVGEMAEVTGAHIGVQAHVFQPLDVTWLAGFNSEAWKAPSELFTHFRPPAYGTPEFVFTSWASAVAQQEPGSTNNAEAGAVAGAVNWTTFKNSAKSWLGAGAKATATGTDQPWEVKWTSPGDLDEAALRGIKLSQEAGFDKALQVKALNQSALLTFTGQPMDIGFNLGTQAGTKAVGGAFNHAAAQHMTVAGADDGATLRAEAGSFALQAASQDRIIAVAPTAGKGEGVAVNLIGAYSKLDNKTVAVLSNKADVKAAALDIAALEDVSVWSAAGAAAYGANQASVGIAVAVNELDGQTLAAIADPGSLSVGTVRPVDFSAGTGTGNVDAVSVRVQADTQGSSGAISASAASVETGDDPNGKGIIGKYLEKAKTFTEGVRESASKAIAIKGDGRIAKFRNELAGAVSANQKVQPKQPEQTSISLTGTASTSVNLGNLDTMAVLDGATLVNKAVKAAGTTDPSQAMVRASNETHQYAVSGTAALLKLNAPQTKAGYGVSGALAIDIEGNDTSASIVNSSLKDFGSIGVQSLASGQRISAGTGIAGSQGNKPSYMVSTSYSMTQSGNNTAAAIDSSTIEGSEAHPSAVEVLAYDKTETGIGALAVTMQGAEGGAVGASVGVGLVRNKVESRVAGVTASQLSRLDVLAYDPVVLGMGVLSLGISAEDHANTLQASMVFAELENSTKAHIVDRDGEVSSIKGKGAVTVQATDVAPDAIRTRVNSLLAANGTPAADSSYDVGAALRAGEQESFGGQSIGSSQPGAVVVGVAVGVAMGEGKTAGAATSASRVALVHEALVEGATVEAERLHVDATDAALLVNASLGVAGTADKLAAIGSTSITINDSRATARVGAQNKSTTVTTTAADTGLGVTAATRGRSFTLAGGVGISLRGKAGGLAGSVAVDNSVGEAGIQNATINASSGATLVDASTASQQINVAAAGGYGEKAVINGSYVINVAKARTSAGVSDSSITAQSLNVTAGDSAGMASRVYTGAGSVGFSKANAGGAAVTSNTTSQTREAAVERSKLTLASKANALQVHAKSNAQMIGVGLAGGGAADSAFNGAFSHNDLSNTIAARLTGSTLSTSGHVAITAADRSEVDFGAGVMSVSSKEKALGAGIASTHIHGSITAELQGTDVAGQRNGSGVSSAGNVRVAAASDSKITNAAYGVAVGQQLGGTGSVVVNVLETNVTAAIGRGADLSADGSVAVEATAQDDIKSFGGALGLGDSRGVGLSSTVNVVRGVTRASIGGDAGAARVKLDALGKGDGLQVNDGTLTQALPGVAAPGADPSGFDGMDAMQRYDATRGRMAEGRVTVKGVAVNATSMRHVLSFDTNAGGAADGVGLGANAGAHLIDAKTVAEVANADLNQRKGGETEQDVALKASSHHVMSTFGLSAGSGVGGVEPEGWGGRPSPPGTGAAAALGSDVFLTGTTASIRDSAVKAARDVKVAARNESAQSGILAGAAGGDRAFAGSVGVVVFDGDVEASILGGSTRAGQNVVVDADNSSTLNLITGTGGLSKGVLGAGALSVTVSDASTRALIGRDSDSSKATTVSSGGNIDVSADSVSQTNTFTLALGAGKDSSVAAIGAVNVITNSTTARVSQADLEVGVPSNWVYIDSSSVGSGGVASDGSDAGPIYVPPTGVLSVRATDHGLIKQISGAAGVGLGTGPGVGGTISVLVAKNNVTAEVKGSEVDTQDLKVVALNSQDQFAGTVGVGGSAQVALGFAISLTMTGTGSPGSDAFGSGSEAKGSQLMEKASSLANSDRLGETGEALSTQERASVQAQSKHDLSSTLNAAGANSATAAVSNSTVRAAKDVSITSQQQTALKNIAGAVGLGLEAGIGGSVGVSFVRNASAAEAKGSTINAGGVIEIAADSSDKGGGKALDLLTMAGAAGGYVGLGASVGIAHLQNDVSAQGGGTLKAKQVSIKATDATSAKAENVSAAVGKGAAGIAVASLDREGEVQAWFNKSGDRERSVTAGKLDIRASTAQQNEVKSLAVAAGLIGAGNGAAGLINDRIKVMAGIGDASKIQIGGAVLAPNQSVNVLATRGASLDSRADGVGVAAGVQIGASVSQANMGGETMAKVGDNVEFDSGSTLTVKASENAANLIKASSTASGGGLLLGASAADARARNTASIQASIGDNTKLPDGAVTLLADHAATQAARSLGVTMGGVLALGSNVAKAETGAITRSTLGNVKTNVLRFDSLDVLAKGVDTTTAQATAGGGALISGRAATAEVKDHTQTRTELSAAGASALAKPADYILLGGALNFDAAHEARVRADANAVNASVLGASGANAQALVGNSVATSLGAGVRVEGLSIRVNASNKAVETGSGDNAAGASGGVVDGSAVVAQTSFSTSSKAEIGKDAQLDVTGDAASNSVGRLSIVASTHLETHTAGSLNTGGLVAAPSALVESKTEGANTVTVGAGAQLRSAGDLILGTSTFNTASATALVKTYGGVGATGGTSTALAKQTDKIDVQAKALLNAYGHISMAAGRSAETALNRLQARAQTDVYNNTAVPISYTNGANAGTEQRSSLDLAAGSQIQAGRSVYLRASQADESTLASGKGHNPYLDLFSTSKDQSSAEAPLFEGAINVQGSVTAGYYRLRDLTIDSGGKLSQLTTDTPDTKLPERVFTMDEQGRYLFEGKVVDAAKALRPIGYIAKIEGFNPSKYYTAEAQRTLGKVPDAKIGAYVLPDLVAAGGNIEVDAKSLTGSGSLRAQGGPQIKVNNGSTWYLIGNQLVIPESGAGGSVSYTGAARKPDSLTVQALDPNRMPSIRLENTLGAGGGDIVIQAVPGVSNALRNAGGNIDLINASGNVWAGGYEALNYKVEAPKGTAVIRAEGYWSAGGSPQSIWWQEDQKLLPMSIGAFVNTAAYAYYWDVLGGRSTSEEEYSRVLQGIRDDGGFDIRGYLFSENLGNVPDRGAALSWYGGRYYFDRLKVKQLVNDPVALPSKPAGQSFANTVNIAAEYIDVNSDIRAGTPKVDVTIKKTGNYQRDDGSPLSFFACAMDAICSNDFGIRRYWQNGVYLVPDSELSYGASTAKVKVTFNPVTGRVSLDPIGTPSVGSITLSGKILNSNADGSNRSKIELASGSLDLKIDNQSGYALDLPRIESGPAGEGVIKITDYNRLDWITNKRGEIAVAPLTTWWVSKDGGAPTVYQSYSASDYKNLAPTAGTQGASTTSYDPLEGQRYQWTRTATATRAYSFSGKDWKNAYVSPWSFDYGAQAPSWTSNAAEATVVFRPGDTSAYSSRLTQRTTFGGKQGVNYTYPGDDVRANRQWEIATAIQLIQTSSIRADYGIDVGFRLSSAGGVVINSNADTYLGKPLNNPGSSTILTTTGNLIGAGGSISSKDLTLIAYGDIRGSEKNQALRVNLSGNLFSISGGSTAIDSLGALRLGVASVGDGQQLRLSAIGDITSTSNEVMLKGYDVRLSSTGRVGGPGVGDPLNIEMKGIGAAAERRGLLTVVANRDIKLNLTGGDTRVVAITAADGDVSVRSNGSLLDGQSGQGRALRSEGELQQLWEQTLKISGSKAASVQDYLKHTINPLDQQVNRDYRDYWALRELGSLGADGKLTLNADGLSKLRAQTAAARDTVNPTDTEVNDWANALLAGYIRSFDSALGAGQWASQAAFQSKDSAYRFSADRYNEYWTLKNATVDGRLTAAGRDTIRQVAAAINGSAPSDAQLQDYVDRRIAALNAAFAGQVPGDKLANYDASYQFVGDRLLEQYAHGIYWGAERLQNSIRNTAFGDPGAGSPVIDHLNISGRNISLSSSAAKAALGRNNADMTLSLGQALSEEQRFALSQATAPGDIQLLTDKSGKPIGLKVRDIRPLFVEARSQFDAEANGAINVQAKGNLAIGTVKSEGGVRLMAQDGITNAGALAHAIKGSSLVLVAGSGSLGTEANPLGLESSELSLARAGGSIWLNRAHGDLVIDAVNAGKELGLTLGNGNLSQKHKGLLSLAADSIALDVGGNIGTAPAGTGTGALVLAMDESALGGTLRIKARDAWLSSASRVTLGDSTTGNFALNLNADADLMVSGDVASSGLLTWLVGGGFSVHADQSVDAKGDLMLTAGRVAMDKGSRLSSGGKLALRSGGDAVLGSLSAKTGMTLDAEGGSLKINDADVVMTVFDAGAALRLNSLHTAGAGIGGIAGGADEAALNVAADVVSVRSSTGDVRLGLRNNAAELQASSLGAGSLFVQAAGSLKISGDVQSGQILDLSAEDGFVLGRGQTLHAGESLRLEAASLTMEAGSQAFSDTASASLLARAGDAQLATVIARTGLFIDAAQGKVTQVGASDRLSVTGPGGLIALNQAAGNGGGLGLGEASRSLQLVAERSSARTGSGGIFLDLAGVGSAAPRLESAVAGTGEIALSAAGDMSAAGPISTTGSVRLKARGTLTSVGAIGALGAMGDLYLEAARLDLAGSLQAGRDASLETLNSDLLLRQNLNAGRNIILNSQSAIQAQDVNAGRDLLLGAGGPVDGERLQAGHELNAWRATQFSVRELASGAAMDLTLGVLNSKMLDAGGSLTLSADRALLGGLVAGGAASLNVKNAIDADLIEAGQDLTLRAGHLRAGSIKAGAAASLVTAGDADIKLGRFGSTLSLQARSASIASLRSGGNTLAQVSEGLSLGAVEVQGQLDVRATSSRIGGLVVAGDVRLEARDSLTLLGSSNTVDGKLSLQARDLDLSELYSTGSASLVASNRLTAQSLGSNATLTLVARSAQLQLAQGVGDASLQISDDLALGGSVGAGLVAEAGSLDVSRLSVAGKTRLTARDALGIASLTAQQAAKIRGNAIDLGSVRLEDSLELEAASLQGGSVRVVGAATLDIANAAQLQSLDTGALNLKADSFKLASLSARGVAQLSTLRELQIDSIKSSQTLELKAAGISGGEWTTNALSLDAGSSATIARLSANGNADLKVGTVLDLKQAQIAKDLLARAQHIQLDDVDVGGNARLLASETVQAQRLKVGGLLDVQAGGLIQLGSVSAVKPLADTPITAAIQVGSGANLSGDTLSLAELQIKGASRLAAKRALSLLASNQFNESLQAQAQNLSADTVIVGGSADFKIVDQLEIARLNAGHAELDASSLKLGSLSLGESLEAKVSKDLVADSLSAAKSITVNAGGAVQAKLLQAPVLTLSAGKAVSLDLLKAETASLKSASQIALAEAQGASLTLQAPQIQGAVKFVPAVSGSSDGAASPDTLSTTLTGLDGAAAQQITLSASFDNALAQRWLIPVVHAEAVSLSTNGYTTQIDKGRVNDSFTLSTPDGLIGLTSGKAQVLPKVEVQMFAPESEFSLIREHQYLDTDALVLVYTPTQIVTAPNTGRTPQDSAGGASTTTRNVAPLRQAFLEGRFEQLLRSMPTTAGKESEEEELVGKLDF